MRIGILAPRLLPEEGGGFVFEAELFRALLRNAGEFNHTFVVFSQKPQPDTQDMLDNCEWVRVWCLIPRIIVTSFIRICNFLLNKVFHLPSISEIEHWIDPLLASHNIEFFLNLTPDTATTRCPYSTFIWDLQHRIFPFFPESSVDGRWIRWEDKFSSLVRRAAIVWVGTEVGKKDVMTYYQVPEERIFILPHPTPDFAFYGSSLVHSVIESRATQRKPYLFYPANFFAHKNHITILRAVALLKERHSIEFNVVFSGYDYGNMDYIKHQTRELGLEEQVQYVGFVDQKELVQLYTNAFATVYASLLGPENLPPLEAFALGCSVIAARIPGAEEQLGDAALLFSPLDENDLAAVILKLKNNKTMRQTLIVRGKKRANKRTSDEMSRQLLGILAKFEPIRRCWGSGYDYKNKVNFRRLLS